MDRRREPPPDAQRLSRMLGGWTTTHGTLPERLARALRELTGLGELVTGTRLPSERVLAAALVVSRATVVSAYDLLHGEGLLDSRPGSGHWIASREGALDRVTPPATFPWPHRLADPRSPLGYPPTTIDLSAIAMTASPILTEVLDAIGTDDWASLTSEWAYLPLGWLPLRHAIAEECSRLGLPTTHEQVLITSGAQQGLSLVVDALVQHGDVVVIEDPAYPGQFPVLRRAGARLLTVPAGPTGLDVGLFEQIVAAESPRLAVLTPTHHNPTGGVLGTEGRARVAGLAGHRGLVVAELYASAELSLDNHRPPPPVAAIGNTESTVVIGSLSAVVWSGLRVGWLRASEDMIALLGEQKAVADLGTPLIPQLVATRLMDRLPELRRLRNAQLEERCRLAIDRLTERIPDFDIARPAGGGCLWFEMPVGQASEFAQVALRYGVAVLPGPLCSARATHQAHLRLAFTGDPTALLVGIERLADAWAVYQAHAR